MYQERRPCPASWARPRGRGWRALARNQCAAWSRQGPETEVKEAIRSARALPVTASQDWIEPQSCPTRWTGRSGLTASSTAPRSASSAARV